jgi:hypothetical protein
MSFPADVCRTQKLPLGSAEVCGGSAPSSAHAAVIASVRFSRCRHTIAGCRDDTSERSRGAGREPPVVLIV